MEHTTHPTGPSPTADPSQIRVLIVDDEALMRAGIKLMIDGASTWGAGSTGSTDPARRIAVVGEAADGAEALAAAHTLDPDVILMDIRMPGMNGIEATRALHAEGSRARIIVLTAFDTDEFILDALSGGAVSFLLKDSAPALVLAAVRDAAAGESKLSPSVMARLIELASTRPAPAGPVTVGGSPAATTGADISRPSAATAPASASASASAPAPVPAGITPREWEVALLVAQGVRTKEIAAALYISTSTVKTHLASLSAKLQVTNRTQIAMRVAELRALQN